jgi:hypothetical protein
VANVALGIHLFHGGWSMFQSLGLNNPRWNSWRRGFAVTFAGVVMLGNLSFPIAVLTGAVSADDNPDCRVSGDTIETCELYVPDAEQGLGPGPSGRGAENMRRSPSGPLAQPARAGDMWSS